MKKVLSVMVLGVMGVGGVQAQQRVVAECTVTYAISADSTLNIDKEVLASLTATTKTVYIKANDCRNDLVSPTYQQTILYNKVSGNATILREFGQNKFMTKMDKARWAAENKKYEGMSITLVPGETKTILGYECKKAVINLKGGGSFSLFYATNIVPSVKEFEYQFRDVPGFVLEYESQEGDKGVIRYTATKINLSPVQASRFDIPVSGYRLLN
jgi:GLPGLI family protein